MPAVADVLVAAGYWSSVSGSSRCVQAGVFAWYGQ
ncbi:hypothetical protein RKD20_006006 [Streptomyces sp. SLBN-8D4]